ncbi:MAG TPA: type VII secretion target [Actinokineospora sp.]|nr:type VII secretion target [Actinokineospora sp.]
MTIAIHTAHIRQAADDIDAALAGAKQNVQASLEPSSAAMDGNPGWQSSAALAECRQAWFDHLNDLVTRTAEAAEKLRGTATDYDEAERRITESLEDLHREPS